MKLKNLLLLIIIPALLAAPTGCIFSPDDDPTPTVVTEDLPPARTPEQLLKNFRTVYAKMDATGYRDLLHDDYKMMLLPETKETWGWEDNYYFDKTEEVAIHTKMFSGEPGHDAAGNLVHPIDSIIVDLLEIQGTWEKIEEADIDFGGYTGGKWANYELLIQFWDADRSHKYEVQQDVNFFAVPVTEDGETIWKMLGQRGLPQNI